MEIPRHPNDPPSQNLRVLTLPAPKIYTYAGLPIERSGVKISSRAEMLFEIYDLLEPLANSSMMSTPSAHYRWEDTEKERTGRPTSYAQAKKIKSLTLQIHGCLKASLWEFSSSSFHTGNKDKQAMQSTVAKI